MHPIDRVLDLRPKTFGAVGVDVTACKFAVGMVHALVVIPFTGERVVNGVLVGVNGRAFFNRSSTSGRTVSACVSATTFALTPPLRSTTPTTAVLFAAPRPRLPFRAPPT